MVVTLAAIVALWRLGGLVAPASEYERLPVSPVPLVGVPVVVLLAFDVSSGGLVSLVLGDAVERLDPLLGVVLIVLFGWYNYRKYIRGRSIRIRRSR